MTNSDHELKRLIEDELRSDGSVDEAHVGVVVHDVIVTLSGHVATSAEKLAAEAIAKRIPVVRAIANDLEVRSSPEIGEHIVAAFKRSAEIDAHRITVEAHDGTVTLRGTVRTPIKKEQARAVALATRGVTAVENNIVVAP